MNILAICGSPRKGNTEFMLNTVLDEITDHKKDLILLREKNIQNCTGCDLCYNEKKPCYIDDDMREIIPKLLKADLIILGSPNYFSNVSGLMKTFMDRTDEVAKEHKLESKEAVIICVGGRELTNTDYCKNVLQEFIRDHKMKLSKSIKAKADAPGDVKNNHKLINHLKDLGRQINENDK